MVPHAGAPANSQTVTSETDHFSDINAWGVSSIILVWNDQKSNYCLSIVVAYLPVFRYIHCFDNVMYLLRLSLISRIWNLQMTLVYLGKETSELISREEIIWSCLVSVIYLVNSFSDSDIGVGKDMFEMFWSKENGLDGNIESDAPLPEPSENQFDEGRLSMSFPLKRLVFPSQPVFLTEFLFRGVAELWHAVEGAWRTLYMTDVHLMLHSNRIIKPQLI